MRGHAPPRPACRRNSGSPAASRSRALTSACAMVSPVTNCSPIMRIAMSTPLRISGSPPRATTWRSVLDRPAVAVRGHQLAGQQQTPGRGVDEQRRALPEVRSASRRRRSCRGSARRGWPASGMRSSASARHISATPSCELSANSCSRPCTRPARPLARARSRTPPAMRSASACAASAWAGSSVACGQQRRQQVGLGRAGGGGDGRAQRGRVWTAG